MNPRFHLCLSPDTIESDPGLLRLAAQSGVSDIWVAGFLYGHWYYSVERIQSAARSVQAAGLAAHVVNLPLGHPGDSLGAGTEAVPLGPPAHWRMGVNFDGTEHSGTSLHAPAVAENCRALADLQAAGLDRAFLDDDFRLAPAPGIIGGCFCADHRRRFLEQQGLQPADWLQLLEDVSRRAFSPLLRAWVDFTCDELSAAFRQQRAAAPALDLGIMAMYLGAEKAGIRLDDYREVPMRVGEYMFDDAIFGPPKGKTDELFSALFHRRFCGPERSYSESTAFPADQLSAANLAAKLVIPILADVRSTLLMSGLSPFPRGHWPALAEAMRRSQSLHPLVAGRKAAGPLKHYWGKASRYTGDDRPYSLFLALGVPFEVVDEPQPGWNFLSQADALNLRARGPFDPQTHLVYRPGDCAAFAAGTAVEETLPALFALKRQVVAQLEDVPYVAEDVPAICAWYPEVRRALIWNLSERAQTLTLRLNARAGSPGWAQGLQLQSLDAQVLQLP